MLKLLFIRHGESEGNRDRRMTGRDDSRLTETGHRQCQQLAAWLHQHPWRPTHIYSSPLRRTVQSVADLIVPWQWQLPNAATTPANREQATGKGHPDSQLPLVPLSNADVPPSLTLSPLLQEFDAGILTGLTWSEARQQYPDLCQRLETCPDWVPIPQAETPLQGRQRAAQFIEQLLHVHDSGQAIWVVSHQWILEHLVAALLGCDRTWQATMPNTALFEFWLDRDRWYLDTMSRHISDHWQIKRFNDCPHMNSPTDVASAPLP